MKVVVINWWLMNDERKGWLMNDERKVVVVVVGIEAFLADESCSC